MRLKLFETFNTDKDFLINLIQDSDFGKDYQQAILNTAYSYWNQPNNNKWNYNDMVNNIDDVCSFDPTLMKLSVQIGKYTQQVGNGGHSQYYQNGYSSGGNNNDSDISFHEEMVDYFIELKLDKKLKIGKKVLEIIEAFDIEENDEDYVECEQCYGTGKEECRDCYGTGMVEEWNEEDEEDEEVDCTECSGEGEIDCDYCGGEGEVENYDKGDIDNMGQLDELDNKWYKVSEDFENEFNNYLKDIFSGKKFQKAAIKENKKNVFYLYKSKILNKELEEKYKHLIDSEELGLI